MNERKIWLDGVYDQFSREKPLDVVLVQKSKSQLYYKIWIKNVSIFRERSDQSPEVSKP